MRLRPLAVVLVLVAVDYGVWNWSLSGGRDLAGMISGLTLPPLLAALVVLALLNLLRAVSGAARRPRSALASAIRRRPAAPGPGQLPLETAAGEPTGMPPAARRSRRIAA